MSEPTCPVCGQPDVLCCGDCVAPHERGDDYGPEPEDTPCLDQDTNIANYDPDWDGQPDDLTEQADFAQDDYPYGYEDRYLDSLYEAQNEYFDDPEPW